MSLTDLISLSTLCSIILLVLSSSSSQVNALVVQHPQIPRSNITYEGAIQKRRHAPRKRKPCKPKSTTTDFVVDAASTSGVATVQTSLGAGTLTQATGLTSATTSTGTSSIAIPTGAVSGQKKVGILWVEQGDLASFGTSHTGFVYNWGPTCSNGSAAAGMACMPMLWGKDDKRLTEFSETVKPGYAKYAMGFNEVNLAQQANMSPDEAADIWIQYLEPLKSNGYYLISPSTTNAPDGIDWMNSFVQKCNGRCHMDALSLHYYGTSATDLIAYIELWHKTFNLPVWLTEFACQDFSGQNKQCSASDAQAFYKQSIAWMESTDYVTAYFAFGPLPNVVNNDVSAVNQMMANGKPNALGEQYINVKW